MAIPAQQIILGTCCDCGGFKVYLAAKVWRGRPRFCNSVRGDTLYLGLSATLAPTGGTDYTAYHGTMNHFGVGPPTPLVFPADYTRGYTDDGSSPPLSSGTYAGPFPYPESSFWGGVGPLRCDNGYIDPLGVYYETVTVSDTSYVGVITSPPDPPVLSTLTYNLSSPYSQSDVLAEAITAARGATVGPGQVGVSSYREDQGAMDLPDLAFTFARSSAAMGTAQWAAAWSCMQPNITHDKPWDGSQVHNVYSVCDGAVLLTPDGVIGHANPHGAYLVSFANRTLEVDGTPNLIRVLCTTFSGSGALATYESNSDGRKFWPERLSCVDFVASNTTLDPTFPRTTVIVGGVLSRYRWQIFFPGKKAVDIPDPGTIWDPPP